MTSELIPIRFIDAEIEVKFDKPPTRSKKPGAPDEFLWMNEKFRVREVLSAWFDYGRKGRMAMNMTPEHLQTASKRGSWGVGRYYFRVRVGTGRVFDLYFDRAPKDAGDRKGHWFLWRELEEKPS
jgi:hypothetical protein